MKKLGRLALREEGTLWNAYYAMPDSMEGALFLGSIQMRFVDNEERKWAFIDLMTKAVADIIEEMTGERPVWNEPQRAPEHERKATHE